VRISVLIDAWNNDFCNAIRERRGETFYNLLGKFTLRA